MAAAVAALLRGMGADVELRMAARGRPNVIGVFEPAQRATTTIALVPHLDTVGVAGMTVPPFQLTQRSGRLHGRGACDTKGPMAALLWALRGWARSTVRRTSGIRWVFVATAGEEEGSLGAQALTTSGFKADFAVALEPTDLKVVHAAKGILRVWIEATGRACHGAQPHRGDNAVYKLLPLALALRDQVAPALHARRHPLLGSASLNLGVMAGGRDINVVPDFARLGLDVRIHPGCEGNEALAQIEQARKQHAPMAALRVHRRGPSFVTPRFHPWARRLRGVGRGWATADWFCDANIFAANGMPAVAFGPGSIVQAHTRDEFITETALRDGADAFAAFLRSGAVPD